MNYPHYWTVLSKDDQQQYSQLKAMMVPLSLRSSRSHAPFKLQVAIDHIKYFAIRRDGDDWKRCLVCGMMWIDEALAVNTRQMSALIGTSKSSINAAFQALGYSTGVMCPGQVASFLRVFPHLLQNGTETRQWTLRFIMKTNIQRSVHITKLAVANHHGSLKSEERGPFMDLDDFHIPWDSDNDFEPTGYFP
jgi:hypothetical protein